jgi:RNA polymerase sigma-70 factor (ECF subfamily)
METVDDSLRRARGGDLDAFGDLVRMHQGWLRGYLRGRLRDWASADDLAQDAFVTAFMKLRDFRGDSSFEVWLRGIAQNHLRNHVRKRREESVGSSEELQGLLEQACEEWDGGRSAGERMEALNDCLDRIEGPARDLLEQRYRQGKSVREISKDTGRGYSALTMQFHRMREMLAECIRSKEGIQES